MSVRLRHIQPGLGLMHTDEANKDALALDLMEPIRPEIDAHVLQLLRTRIFSVKDF